MQSLRGMNDILPGETPVWQHLEATLAELLAGYGYQEIRFPLLESTELFQRSIGEVTDIVEKEMYSFIDRNGDSVTLRPEGTAGCARACAQHGLLRNQVQRLWYRGPMFRHERPQKGRLRQFHQVGAEVFGLPGPDIDAEMLAMTERLWRRLGIREHLELQINSLGSGASRAAYRAALVAYLERYRSELDDDSQRRLDTNPLRILDSKVARTREILGDAPVLADYLDAESRDHFAGLCQLLEAAGIRYSVNHRLVRGLDYYGKTVFEWVSDRLGAQATACAGGRYDGLVEQLGGKPAPGVGWGLGIERLLLLLEEVGVLPPAAVPDAYAIVPSAAALAPAMVLADALRAVGVAVLLHPAGKDGPASMKSQFKKADASGAAYALVFGAEELAQGMVALKPLRGGEGAAQRLRPLANPQSWANELQAGAPRT